MRTPLFSSVWGGGRARALVVGAGRGQCAPCLNLHRAAQPYLSLRTRLFPMSRTLRLAVSRQAYTAAVSVWALPHDGGPKDCDGPGIGRQRGGQGEQLVVVEAQLLEVGRKRERREVAQLVVCGGQGRERRQRAEALQRRQPIVRHNYERTGEQSSGRGKAGTGRRGADGARVSALWLSPRPRLAAAAATATAHVLSELSCLSRVSPSKRSSRLSLSTRARSSVACFKPSNRTRWLWLALTTRADEWVDNALQ